LFDDYSINTSNNIKIEKKGDKINFDIKKITRIGNDNENKLINNKSKKIEETLRDINDNVIIYIKPLKLKSNIINKNKVDYIFLKKRQNNSENKLKTKKYFLTSLFSRRETNSKNDLKNNNFENNLKNKIKYFKSEDIFSEIVKIINSLSNNNKNYFANLTNTKTKSVNSNSTNKESVISNSTYTESVNSNSSNISNVNFYTNDKLNYKRKISVLLVLITLQKKKLLIMGKN